LTLARRDCPSTTHRFFQLKTHVRVTPNRLATEARVSPSARHRTAARRTSLERCLNRPWATCRFRSGESGIAEGFRPRRLDTGGMWCEKDTAGAGLRNNQTLHENFCLVSTDEFYNIFFCDALSSFSSLHSGINPCYLVRRSFFMMSPTL
jgi:hypothetical protein